MTSSSDSEHEFSEEEQELEASLAFQLIRNSRLKWGFARALVLTKLDWIVAQVKDMKSAAVRFAKLLESMTLTDRRKNMLVTNGAILVKCNKLNEKIAAAMDNIKSVELSVWEGPLPTEADLLLLTTAEKDLITQKWEEGEMIIKNFYKMLDELKAEWEQLEEFGKEITTLMGDTEIRIKGDYDKYI